MKITDLPEAIRELVVFGPIPVGSRVTCNPPPTDTDADFLILLKADAPLYLLDAALTPAGWALGGTAQDDENFESYTRGEDNLLFTTSYVFYSRFIAATSVAKRLNVMEKSDRKSLFQAVLYSNACDDAED